MTNWEIASVFGTGVAGWALYKLMQVKGHRTLPRDLMTATGSGGVSFLVLFIMLQMTLGSV